MVLNHNQVSSKRLKIILARKYTSQVFFVSETSILGVSPDGVMSDRQIVVEVKKIVLKEGESLDGMCRLGIYKKNDSKLRINKSHKNYYQMQQ